MTKLLKKVCWLLVVLTALGTYQFTAFAAVTKITSVKNVEISVNLNESFKLPKTVTATLNGKTTKELPVVWNKQKINTSIAGVYKFTGVVKGYKSKVLLTLNVTAPAPTPTPIPTPGVLILNQRPSGNESVDVCQSNLMSPVNGNWNIGTVSCGSFGTLTFKGTPTAVGTFEIGAFACIQGNVKAGSITFKSSDLNKVVSIGNKIYMIDNNGGVKEYDPSLDKWSNKSQIFELAQSQGVFKLVTLNNCIYIIGANYTSILKYNPQDNSCVSVATLPNKMTIAGAVAVDNKIYVLGGTQYGLLETLGTLDVYDVSNNTWTSKKGPAKSAFNYVTSEYNGKIYILGANNITTKNQSFEEYDIQSDKWSSIEISDFTFSGLSINFVNGKMYIIGNGPTGTGLKLGACEIISVNWLSMIRFFR